MNNKQVEKKISDAFNNIEVDRLQSILSDCSKQEKRMIFVENNQRNNLTWMYRGLAFAASFLVVFTMMFAYAQRTKVNDVVAATISLDVNPSIEIKINKEERVLDVIALNDDALVILDDMNFKGSDLKVTINALIGSLVRNGYINELTNSILVSVEDSDELEARSLEEELLDVISNLIESGSVLAQQVKVDDTVKQISETYGITVGKAQMIKELADKSTMYEYEDLAGLSINELNLLSKNLNDSKLIRNGQPSDKAYIGMTRAKEIALNDLGVNENDVYLEKIELDYENRKMVYEVEFTYSNIEYEYVIDAATGEIITTGVEGQHSNMSNSTPASSSNTISEAKAKEIALNDAGISEDQISYYRIEKEYDDGVVKYEIDFYAGNAEYDYDIDAISGNILKKEKEFENDTVSSSASTDDIGIDKAKQIASEHAGASQVYEMEADRDESKYEISFKANGYNYEYDISFDGTILKAEKEISD